MSTPEGGETVSNTEQTPESEEPQAQEPTGEAEQPAAEEPTGEAEEPTSESQTQGEGSAAETTGGE
jgi:hypothetical protein